MKYGHKVIRLFDKWSKNITMMKYNDLSFDSEHTKFKTAMPWKQLMNSMFIILRARIISLW